MFRREDRKKSESDVSEIATSEKIEITREEDFPKKLYPNNNFAN